MDFSFGGSYAGQLRDLLEGIASKAEPRKVDRGLQRNDSGEDSRYHGDGKRKSADLRDPVHFRLFRASLGGAVVPPRFRR
jgi:hypothetical protein